MDKLVHEEQIAIEGGIDEIVQRVAATLGEVPERDSAGAWRFDTGSRAVYSMWGAYFQPAAIPLDVRVTTRDQPGGVALVTVTDRALGALHDART